MAYNKEYSDQLLQKDRDFCKKFCSNNGIELIDGIDSYTYSYDIMGAKDKNTGEYISRNLSMNNYRFQYDISDLLIDCGEGKNLDGKVCISADARALTKYVNIAKNFRLGNDGYPIFDRITYSYNVYDQGETCLQFYPCSANPYHLDWSEKNLNLIYIDNTRILYENMRENINESTLKSLGELEVVFDVSKKKMAKVELGFSSIKISLPSEENEIVVDNKDIDTVISILANWMSSQETYKNNEVIQDNAKIILEFIYNKLSTSMAILSDNPDLYIEGYEFLQRRQEKTIEDAKATIEKAQAQIQVYAQEIKQLQQQAFNDKTM